MSENSKNKQCQICKGYLFADDDTVICPVCGAPHHRDCWKTVGHCGVEDKHGTDEQYDLKEKNDSEQSKQSEGDTVHVCPNCRRSSHTTDAEFCPYCGHSYSNDNHGNPHVFVGGVGFNPFDMYGGVSKDAKIEDVKVKDLATFVGSDSPRYINRFAALSKKKKGSWNWAAFLFPGGWCLSRKMIPLGIMYIILNIASTICLIPALEIINTLSDGQSLGYSEMYSLVESNLDKFDLLALIFMFLGVALNFIPRIICGRLGDWHYRGFAIEKTRKILDNNEIDNKTEALQRAGNVSLLWLIIAYLVTQYLPSIIMTFI